MIGDEKIAEIRERTDIVALIGEYVALKRAGAQFKGLCPFHSEKSPSFHVHPERQFFHCFGCQTSGDSFAFVMKLEGKSFIEAARFHWWLAVLMGVLVGVISLFVWNVVRRIRAERLDRPDS